MFLGCGSCLAERVRLTYSSRIIELQVKVKVYSIVIDRPDMYYEYYYIVVSSAIEHCIMVLLRYYNVAR